MSSLRPELHVAQQLRRDKLRIHETSSSQHQHLQQEFPNNLEQYLSLHPEFNLDLLQARDINNNVRNANILDEAPLYSSEVIPPHQYASFPHSSSTIIHSSPKQQCGNWMVNHGSTSSSVANQSNNLNSILPFELNNNMSTHQKHYDHKPSCNTNIVVTDAQSSSPSLYQNSLQDIFKSSSISGNTSEMASLQENQGILGGNASESVLYHQSYANQANMWTNQNSFNDKMINGQQQQQQKHGRNVFSDSKNPQGLSLSLSSNSLSNPCSQFEFDTQSLSGVSKHVKSFQESIPMGIPSNNTTHRNIGPLGPFTGYATILKCSRFLKPCQELLDQLCSRCRGLSASTSADVDENWVAEKRGISGASSFTLFYNSNEDTAADGGALRSFCISSRPECQMNKANLLFMQEEVTRRYRQYHQQMQMVVSSFESVAGLSSATPYISLALKSVSRHFKCLKNGISNQVKLVCEVLGEDSSIPTTSTTTSSGKFDTNIARLRCMDQSSQKNKSGGSNMDIVESQQHLWRPQRGLPDRAVTILKAWLFEHFLHPYPSDTDKHMLASQTGLSRNQVSNWFINARVRVWKPMVEEIHNLETKGTTTGANNNPSKNEGTSCVSEGSSSRKFGERGYSNDEHGNLEKRSKFEMASSMEGTLMGFTPYRHGGGPYRHGGGGLGSVSLTLGLMHDVEGVQHQQQQLQQEQEQQLRGHFGGHMIHDFVG
ncbi:PREDICTED: BEL1-like homeodomain protein 8 isoform X1 [Lupinus angustifolius]|uniref:BEL1-like homeodomain protein 8 isoform X1 n=1 Tax=Lupinus angustifolius TaxID=3871 RepID=UPI00092F5B17|nr:PREDICTED: BEL1-like homeodomain protein 8 isoform X1 [Lupinus angustifolius]XP_019448785.1 PREDICTED: BEL1-like homeodomain protein 8 isoform X1 [Lupinus angustifolius]XP_019448786.1 PREDICTED: BEL1-like homeodomain protein 8 isoform X1 [Lupinus angustifolius]